MWIPKINKICHCIEASMDQIFSILSFILEIDFVNRPEIFLGESEKRDTHTQTHSRNCDIKMCLCTVFSSFSQFLYFHPRSYQLSSERLYALTTCFVTLVPESYVIFYGNQSFSCISPCFFYFFQTNNASIT